MRCLSSDVFRNFLALLPVSIHTSSFSWLLMFIRLRWLLIYYSHEFHLFGLAFQLDPTLKLIFKLHPLRSTSASLTNQHSLLEASRSSPLPISNPLFLLGGMLEPCHYPRSVLLRPFILCSAPEPLKSCSRPEVVNYSV